MKIRYILCTLILILTNMLSVNAENGEASVYSAYDTICNENGGRLSTYITRGEFISLLMESMGYNKDIYVCSFNDVYDASRQYKYIANAENRAIAIGCHDGQFLPDKSITAEEAVTFISRAFKIKSTDIDENNIILNVSDYAKGYIVYSIRNDLYPKKNNELIPADSFLFPEEAVELIDTYMHIDKSTLAEIDFLYGYPKITESGSNEYISVIVKCNKPSKVFFDIKETASVNSAVTPDKNDLIKLLGEVPYKDYEIRLLTKAEKNVRYNIYLTAEDKDGNRSRVYTMRNVMTCPYTQGDGTSKNPYRIYTAYQLEQIRYYTDKCFLLCNDIEYNGVWEPIGNVDEQASLFSGTFNGGGYSITGLEINGGDRVGMFSALFGATVKALSVEATVTGKNYVGIIAGESIGGTIENCHTAGSVTADENIAGGIVGKNGGVINNCVSACYYVESRAYSGGVAGNNSGDIKQSLSCVSYISSDMYASGIAGINTNGIIKACVAASREVTDTLTKNSGRITTNREKGRTENNYAYQEMVSGSTAYLGADLQDGDEVSWIDLTGQEFYSNRLKWDFRNIWIIKNDADFIMPVIRNVNQPELIPGMTVYMPFQIYTEEQLRDIEKNKHYHYVLKNDIILSDNASSSGNWMPIGIAYDEEHYVEEAFCGTFDGKGHSVKNIKMIFDNNISQYGFFGVVYGGTVRNLKLENVNIEGHSKLGGVAAVNYGIIENCVVSGKISAYAYGKETMAGGISAVNYTNIFSSDVNAGITINAVSSNVGGITAYNEGFVNDCMYNGDIEAVSKKDGANSVLGNIVGVNYSGFVYNCFGAGKTTSITDISYCGGVVGMHNGGEIYKCSSKGTIYVSASTQRQSSAYCGGITGIISGGLIMNCFTQDNISTTSNNTYVGGISGYCENSNIQNVYSANTINQKGRIFPLESADVFSGGITGYNVNGNISGTVALNPYITSNGKSGMIAAYSEGGYVDNNYYLADIYSNGEKIEGAVTGVVITAEQSENIDFYFNSIENGGLLGWSGSVYDDVWKAPLGKHYYYPVLSGVKNQDTFIMQ